ncbi:MAG TPA: tyrosine-type recombinase/integrase [Saprospiraceae bacterium]|nr:tyrosine-type recombinase/integrase [Saprospiraceae bacterium]
MSTHLDTFRRYLEFEKRYSSHTVQAYIADISAFLAYVISAYEINDTRKIQHFHVRSWMVSLLESGQTSRSVNRKLSSLRSFFRFLLKHGIVQANPLTKIQPPKSRKSLPSVIDEKSLGKLRESLVPANEYTLLRDRAVIELLYGLGLRQAELINLKADDIDLTRMQVRVMGKRMKQRVIPFGKHLTSFLMYYISQRALLSCIQSERLILTDNGKAAYPKLIYRIVHKYLSLVSTVEHRSPHTLRHSYATHMLEAGASIEAIKELLGHASLAATQVYTHTSIERLKKTYRQAHPKA